MLTASVVGVRVSVFMSRVYHGIGLRRKRTEPSILSSREGSGAQVTPASGEPVVRQDKRQNTKTRKKERTKKTVSRRSIASHEMPRPMLTPKILLIEPSALRYTSFVDACA